MKLERKAIASDEFKDQADAFRSWVIAGNTPPFPLARGRRTYFFLVCLPSVKLFKSVMAQFFKPSDVMIYVLSVIFIATLIRSAIGFGEALIAVPLLAMRIPLKTAAPLAVMISVTIAAIIVVQDWRKVYFRPAARLLAPTLFGIPIGLLLLTSAHQQAVKLLLALVIICFAVYSLSKTHRLELKQDSNPWLLVCGFFAGILGGAYGMNGPPLAIYGTMRRWPPQHFRATLQGYFLPASIVGMGGYLWNGLWSSELTHYYLLSLPATVPAIWLGRAVNHRLPVETFSKYVFGGLIIIGMILATQAFLLPA